jgi:dipeptidyl aminopeptidase/acylaminoacyl peptidase
MLWMSRDGTTTPLRAVPSDWRGPYFSPDGQRLVFHVDDGRQLDIYTYEWAHDVTTRLTFGPAVDSNPQWSPDGGTIVFSSTPSADQLANLYWVSADGSGEPHRLTESAQRQFAGSWHPSGKYLALEPNPRSGTGGTQRRNNAASCGTPAHRERGRSPRSCRSRLPCCNVSSHGGSRSRNMAVAP